MKHLFAGVVAFGLLLVIASFIWPKFDTGASERTNEQTKAYADASVQYHSRSYLDLSKDENRRLLDEAKAEWEKLNAELVSARDRGERVARWLWRVGAVLAAGGAVGVMATRDS